MPNGAPVTGYEPSHDGTTNTLGSAEFCALPLTSILSALHDGGFPEAQLRWVEEEQMCVFCYQNEHHHQCVCSEPCMLWSLFIEENDRIPRVICVLCGSVSLLPPLVLPCLKP